MVQIRRLTGMRPGEVRAMRTCDVDRSAKVWAYRLADHKTAHFGQDRTAFMGRKAQAVLEELLRPNPVAYLFRPAGAEENRRAKMHEERKRNGPPLSQGNAPGTDRKRRPKWKPGGGYDVAAFRRGIEWGC